MKYMHIDLETYSSVPLPKTGVYPYAESGDFEILLFGASVDGGPVRVYDLAQGGEVPEDVLAALADDGVIKYAHNASFERICLSRYLRDKGVLGPGEYLRPEGWRCTMVWSAYAGLPLSLKTVGEALHLEEGKMDEGKDLIRFFCGPVKPTKTNGGRTRNRPEDAPEKWELFKAYNRRDVEVEMRIAEKLSSLPVPDEVWQQYHESEAINDRGIAVDRALVRSAIRLDAMAQHALTEEMQAITDVGNPRSVQQMKEWLAQNGLEVESLGKKEVATLISTAPEPLRTVLTLRSEIAKSSVKKYTAMQNALCADGRLRGMFMFYGANRSGRFSGRIVQLQNLYRNSLPDLPEARSLVRKGDYESIETLYDSVPGVLAECTRTAFIPSPGNHYVVADFSAIEARVLAWMAGETWREKVFEDGGDIYCASASQMFHVPVVKHGENGHLRQKGKIAELALGYGGSVGALRAMGALEMGLEEAELQPLVDAWRTANPRIVQFWWNIDRAVKQAVQEQTACRVGCLTFRYGRGFLFIQLPSGRRLCYAHPRIGSNRFGGESIEYMGMDATKHWSRVESYGPKFVENCIAEGSLVITEQGPVPIERVTPGMKVWDGEQYVAHSGVACKGVQPTICVDGLRMTPEHRILSSVGWVEARCAPGLHWMDFLMGPDRHRIHADYEVKPMRVYDILDCGQDHRFGLWNGHRACIVHNCTQAISRDILCYAMHNLRDYGIVAHVHDEVICDVPKSVTVEEVSGIMGRTPPWAPGLLLRADGYTCPFYQKDS